MPRHKPEKPQTDEEKFRAQIQSEQELSRLQSQYSLLERDRDQLFGGFKLARIRNVITIFNKEHNNILTDLEVATAPTKKKQDHKVSRALNDLLVDHDDLEFQVNAQRQYINEIDFQIKAVEKEVVRLRSLQTADRQHEERVSEAMKRIDALENKLDVQNKKFGVYCAKNRKLKEEIDMLLMERRLFLKHWNTIIDKLVLGKRFMMDLIEQATIAYDQREQWCSKLQALRLKAHYDLVNHVQQMRELKRKQDCINKLENFLDTKEQRRIMKDLDDRRKLQRMDEKMQLKERRYQYQQYINSILEFTKESEIRIIAKKFYNQEAENFSLYLQVNNLHKEMESLGDQLTNFYEEIDNHNEINRKRKKQQTRVLAGLDNKLHAANDEAEKADQELERLESYLSTIKSGIDTLFKVCRCDKDPIMQLLGDQSTINNYNIFFYIKLIEDMVAQAVIDIFASEKTLYDKRKIPGSQRIVREIKEKAPFYALDQITGSSPCPLCVEYEVVGDVIDTVQHVMTRSEAKNELRNRLENTDMATEKVHNVSACFLPKSRQIVQKRYQET